MFVVVLGAGEIGVLLAKRLIQAGHELVLIDRDPAMRDSLERELGSVAVGGDGTDIEALATAGVNRADVFVATTDSDEDNLMSCQIARHRFGVRQTMAIANVPEHARLFGLLGIEASVDLPDLVVRNIQQHLEPEGTVHAVPIPGKRGRTLITVKVSRESHMAGRSLREVVLPQGSLISLVIARDGTALIPDDDTQVQAEDEILAIARSQQQDELRDLLAAQFGEAG